MTRFRIVGLALVAIIALSAITASGASAAFSSKAEWLGKTGSPQKNGGTGSGGTAKLVTTGDVVTCTSSTSTGSIGGNGTMTATTTVTFKGCEGEAVSTKAKCKVKSTGEAEGTVKTTTLSGKLGLVKSAEATSEVGLELENSTEFTTLEGTCLTVSPSKVTGKVAGEVKPVNTKTKTGELVFALSSGKQKIKEICTALPFPCAAEGGDKPKLTVFGLGATEETTQTITFEEEGEVKAA